MAQVLVFGNEKGGVGKTTTVTNVGHGLVLVFEGMKAANGKVLIIDTDSQEHSTKLLTKKSDYTDNESLVGVLLAQANGGDVATALQTAIHVSDWHEKLHVLPAGRNLSTTEMSISNRDGNVFWLEDIIEHLREEYTAILFDTSPKLSLLTKMALLASDSVIIPVAPKYLDVDGLANFINEIEVTRKSWRHSKPRINGIIVTQYAQGVKGHNDIRNAIKEDGYLGRIYLGDVPQNVAIEYSQAHHLSIFEYDIASAAGEAYVGIVQKIARMMVSGVKVNA